MRRCVQPYMPNISTQKNKAMHHDTLPKPKGFIFDYGGTIDTRGCHWGKMIWHAYERHHVPVDEASYRDAYVYAERTLGRNPIIQSSYDFRTTLGVKLRIQMEYLLEHNLLGASAPHDAEAMASELLDDLYSQVRQTVAESRTALETLSREVPLVLVSNFYGNIGVVLHEMGLDGLFTSVVESAVVGVRKPDPRIFSMGVETLGLEPSQVVVVGDSYSKDIVAGSKAGCRTVWVRGEGWTAEEPDLTLPEAVVESISEIPLLYDMANKIYQTINN